MSISFDNVDTKLEELDDRLKRLETRGRSESKEGLRIYRGVIVDNNPSERGTHLCKYKVKILGMHDASHPVENLPLAECMGPTAFGLVGGVGVSSIMHKGTWVYVLFEDNDDTKPIIIGTIQDTTTENELLKKRGFVDPTGQYPSKTGSGSDKTDPDKSGKADGQPRGHKADKTDRNNRPDVHPYLDNEYLTLQMWETECGHTFEWDDTPGNRRIKIWHATGSFFEIIDNGDIYVYGVNDGYYKFERDLFLVVGRHWDVKVGYNGEGNHTEWIKNDQRYEVMDNQFTTVHKNQTNQIDQNRDTTVDQNESKTVHQNQTNTIDDNQSTTVHANRTVQVDGYQSTDVTGQIKRTSGAKISDNAPRIDHN